MTNVFPNSNLPSASQPWGREVQKRVTNLESQFSLLRTNSATIDAQLQASYRRLDETVKGLLQADLDIQAALAQSNIAISDASAAATSANNAIDGLVGLGESSGGDYSINANNITAGTINANLVNVTNINASNITAGTITGITFRTQSSGARIQLTATRQTFFDDFGGVSGYIETSGYRESLFIQGAGSAGLSLSSDGAYITSNGMDIKLNSEGIQTFGPITFMGKVYGPGMDSASTNVSNVRRNTGPLKELVHTNQSSIRFKKDIVDLNTVEEINPKKLLDIPVRAFKYKDDYPLSPDDCRYGKLIPGFIAEEVYESYPIGADLDDEDHTIVQNWNERIIVPGMLALIQELYQRIETLEKGA